MTMAIHALKAAKVDFESFTYDYTPHGGDSLGFPRYFNVPPAYEGRNFTYEE